MTSPTPVIPAKAGISRFWPLNRPQEDARLRWHDGRGKRATVASLLLLAACSSHPDTPGATTADEARQLDDAAAMLDANSVDANAPDPTNESAS